MLRYSLTSMVNLAVPAVRQPEFVRMEERALGGSSKEAQARAEAKFYKTTEGSPGGSAGESGAKAQVRAVDVRTFQLKSLWLASWEREPNESAVERLPIRSRSSAGTVRMTVFRGRGCRS